MPGEPGFNPLGQNLWRVAAASIIRAGNPVRRATTMSYQSWESKKSVRLSELHSLPYNLTILCLIMYLERYIKHAVLLQLYVVFIAFIHGVEKQTMWKCSNQWIDEASMRYPCNGDIIGRYENESNDECLCVRWALICSMKASTKNHILCVPMTWKPETSKRSK